MFTDSLEQQLRQTADASQRAKVTDCFRRSYKLPMTSENQVPLRSPVHKLSET